MLLSGVDEAGRGPVIGPLVLCLASVDSTREEKLVEMGVADSKKLTFEEREELYPKILRVCECRVRKISAAELNKRMGMESLNLIEAREMGGLAEGLAGKLFIDLPERDAGRFLRKAGLAGREVVAEHKADAKYPIVGAASIVAKVERDMEIAKLGEELGEIGSGYPSDERTMNALKNPQIRKKLEGQIRTRWSTMDRILNPTLLDF